MIALTAALDGICLLLGAGRRRAAGAGRASSSPATGTTVLRDGELLRSVHLPAAALTGVATYRQGSLHAHGRSAVLLIGRARPGRRPGADRDAATKRPYQLVFPQPCRTARRCRSRWPSGSRTTAYVDDVHGLPVWRRHLTRRFAEEIRAELAA